MHFAPYFILKYFILIVLILGGPNAEVYRNRKGFFSLNVQVICNTENYILDIVSRWPGSTHDSHMFRNSFIQQRFENNEFDNAVLIGDSVYSLSNYLMTPLANPITPAEDLYNRSHISTRTIVERTIGIWKRRFAVLTMGLRCKTELTQLIQLLLQFYIILLLLIGIK